jgi:hypothetical protein
MDGWVGWVDVRRDLFFIALARLGWVLRSLFIFSGHRI